MTASAQASNLGFSSKLHWQSPHPLNPIKTAVIFAVDEVDGRPFIEGWASILGKCQTPHHYRVRFLDERSVCVRFINPEWQLRPTQSLAFLIAFWRANRSPESFETFFPN